MRNSNMSQLHTPFIPNEEGSVYQVEPVHVPHRTTNIIQDIKDAYEYSQPISVNGTGAHQRTILNPFNTPAQVAVLLLQCGDVGGTIQISIDTSDITVYSGENPNGVPGWITTGVINTATLDYWIDFYTNVKVMTSNITTTYNVILGFRRLRDIYIPRNVNMMNELTQ